MKLICRCCRNLVDENLAIKMNEAEFKEFEFDKAMRANPNHSTTAMYSYTREDRQCYTQICEPCWRSSK